MVEVITQIHRHRGPPFFDGFELKRSADPQAGDRFGVLIPLGAPPNSGASGDEGDLPLAPLTDVAVDPLSQHAQIRSQTVTGSGGRCRRGVGGLLGWLQPCGRIRWRGGREPVFKCVERDVMAAEVFGEGTYLPAQTFELGQQCRRRVVLARRCVSVSAMWVARCLPSAFSPSR